MAGDCVDNQRQSPPEVPGFTRIPTLLTFDHGVGAINVPYPADSVEAKIFAKNKDSIGHVLIHVDDGQGHTRVADLGSGFFFSKDGLMLTDNHVTELPGTSYSIGVVTSDGKEHPATVVQNGHDPSTDSALLQVSKLTADETFKPVTLSQSSHLGELKHAYVLAFPGQCNPLTLSPGTTKLFGSDASYGQFAIQNKGLRQGDPVLSSPTRRVLQVDANVKRGESGGPAFDDEGNVIGKIEMVSLTPDTLPIAVLTTVEDLNAFIARTQKSLPTLQEGTFDYAKRYILPKGWLGK